MSVTAQRAARSARKPAPKVEAPAPSRADKELAAMQAYITKITSSKKEAMGFLKRAGIVDGAGQLDKHYRS